MSVHKAEWYPAGVICWAQGAYYARGGGGGGSALISSLSFFDFGLIVVSDILICFALVSSIHIISDFIK